MGVMSCDKRGCDNIMCQTCINGSYYICASCQEEFKQWIKTQQPLYLDSKKFIYEKFEEFMDIEKEEIIVDSNIDDIIDDFLNTY